MKRALLWVLAGAGVAAAQGVPAVEIADRINDLRDGDPARRAVAVEALVRIGVAAVPALDRLSSDGDWGVRRDAARALAWIGGEEVRPALETCARDRVWTVREAAARGLAAGALVDALAADPIWRVRLAVTAAAPPATLRGLMTDRMPVVRLEAARAMSARGGEECRADMAAMLADPEFRDFGFQMFVRIGCPEDEGALRALFDLREPEIAARAIRCALDRGFPVEDDLKRYVAEILRVSARPEPGSPERRARLLEGLDALGPAVAGSLVDSLEEADPPLAVQFGAMLDRLGPALDIDRARVAFRGLTRHRDPAVRILGLAALGRRDGESARAEAVRLLQDGIDMVRGQAVSVLGQTPEGRGSLRDAWDQLGPADRTSTAALLAASVEPASDALMERLVADPDAFVRHSAFRHFISRRHRPFLQTIEVHYRKEREERIRADLLAAAIDSPIAQEGLLDAALDDRSAALRRTAVGAVARMERGRGEVRLRRSIHDADPAVRETALAGLDAMAPLADVDTFGTALQDGHAGVRAQAARALARRGGARALAALALALRDDSSFVRLAAIDGISRFPEPIAAPLLLASLEQDPDPLVRTACARHAARFPDSLPRLVKIAGTEESPMARAAIVSGISSAPGVAAAATLRNFAADPDPLIRAAVAEGMGSSPLEADAGTLERLARDPSPAVRIAAAAATARLPGPGAIPALRGLLHDGHGAVRREAVFALAVRGELRPAREWLASNAYDAGSRLDLASRVAAEGELAHALDLLLLGSPVDGETSGLAGTWALELGLFDVARGLLTRGLATNPLDADLTWARLSSALQAAREGKPEAAVWIRNCVDSAQERVDALNAAAYLLAENGLLIPMALDFASEAAAAGDPHVLDTLGWTQLAAGLTTEAARTFRSFESRDGTILYHKAIALALAGESEMAAGSLRSALVARPGLEARARRHAALTPLFLHTELLPWR